MLTIQINSPITLGTHVLTETKSTIIATSMQAICGSYNNNNTVGQCYQSVTKQNCKTVISYW